MMIDNWLLYPFPMNSFAKRKVGLFVALSGIGVGNQVDNYNHSRWESELMHGHCMKKKCVTLPSCCSENCGSCLLELCGSHDFELNEVQSLLGCEATSVDQFLHRQSLILTTLDTLLLLCVMVTFEECSNHLRYGRWRIEMLSVSRPTKEVEIETVLTEAIEKEGNIMRIRATKIVQQGVSKLIEFVSLDDIRRRVGD